MIPLILSLLLLHEESVSSSRLEIHGQEVRIAFTFSLEDLAGLARLDLDRSGVVEPEEWALVLPEIFAYVGRNFRIAGGDDPWKSEGSLRILPPAAPMKDGRMPVKIEMIYRSTKPVDRVTLRCDLFREHGGNPRHVAEVPGGRTIVFDKDRSEAEVRLATEPRRTGRMLSWGAAAAAIGFFFAWFANVRRRGAAGAT